MGDQFKITIHPMLDTGIGQEQGYADDKEFVAAVKAERERMDPDVRGAIEGLERDVLRRMLFGS